MEKIVEPKVYFRTGAALLALLALTWTIGYVDLGPFNLLIALTIAMAKALLIALFFMHIKHGSRLLHLAAIAGIIWLLILLCLTLSDYFTRGMSTPQSAVPTAGKHFVFQMDEVRTTWRRHGTDVMPG